MRVSVDQDMCQGHGVCYMTTPEIFQTREEDGQACVVLAEIPPELEDAAILAQQSCPERAITVE